jgi:hypothetical protein
MLLGVINNFLAPGMIAIFPGFPWTTGLFFAFKLGKTSFHRPIFIRYRQPLSSQIF